MNAAVEAADLAAFVRNIAPRTQCKICNLPLPLRDVVNEALLEGVSGMAVSRWLRDRHQYAVGSTSAKEHRRVHLRKEAR